MSPASRRQVLTAAAAGAGGAAASVGLAACTAGSASAAASAGASASASGAVHGTGTVPFHGAHQAGIETPGQAHAVLVALDLKPGVDRAAARRMMILLSDDAARLTQGQPALGDTEPEMAVFPARLTVTFGFGPTFFDKVGLAGQRPPSVAPLPAFPKDALEAKWSGGDVLLQICCDDPATVWHTLRMLTKDAREFATVRWMQRGFAMAHGTAAPGTTPRNVFGQVDGTIQPKPGAEFDTAVWATGPGWFKGGSVMVVRRIVMNVDTWDAFDPAGKELVLGRRLSDGSPLTGKVETDVADLNAVDANGFHVIDDAAHVRLAKATTPVELMRRRGYSYDDGPNPDGTSNAGLIFVAFMADASATFVPVQKRLAAKDALNKWITHIGSAVFAAPPGAAPGEYVGKHLLEG
jgi:dye decolorizing peroxidase